MSNPAARPGTAQSYVELRRASILAEIGGTPRTPFGHAPITPERLEHLRREAEELYWNELAWEELTDEEVIEGGHLTELVFPAFLTFVDGLLPAEDGSGASRARPAAVEEILTFLGERYARFTAQLEAGADSERIVWARLMTARLIDLVLYRLYALTPAERERLEPID